jgi:NADPH-dependent 2,4-dienoyl-CoA reductase/sulfur reductase-like enzyme
MSLDLRTGQPLWTIGGPNIAKHTKLTKDIRSEVVVVGGGISGALMAHKLADRGMEVTVADGRKIGAESRRRAPPSYRMKRTSI